MTELLERETESAALVAAVADAAAGTGSAVLVSGPAGIGKTALLDAARTAARQARTEVLTARASELDRGFGFGIVHQLLEPAIAGDATKRAKLFDGAAGRAAVVFDPKAEPLADAEYSVLSGLFWLVSALSESSPLLLIIDDLQWADAASVRFVEYLTRRIDDLPVCLVATLRTGEPTAADELVDAIVGSPATRVIEPAPLGPDAIGALLRESLATAPAPEFLRAALGATGGNPLLATTLATEIAALALTGSSDEAPKLESLVARGVAPAVTRRLSSLGDGAIAVARAVVVIGERGGTEEIAALSGQSNIEVREATDQLVAADVLAPATAGFVHPLVRAAVAEAMPAGEQQRLHRLAAERLRASGARPAEIAVHWLRTDPEGDARTVADLRAAAQASAAEGATESAVDLLRRALAEPPPGDQRAVLLLELGELEMRAQLPEGVQRLRDALDAGSDGEYAARARAALGTFLVHTGDPGAFDELGRAYEQTGDAGLKLRLEALMWETLLFPDVLSEQREARFAAGRADKDASPVMLAHLALQSSLEGAPLEVVRDYGARAVAGGQFMEHIGPGSSTWNLLTHSYRFAEDPDRSKALLVEGETLVRERGLRSAGFFVEQSWGYWHRDFGSVATGAARSLLGLELIKEAGLVLTIPALAAIAAENLLALDRLDQAAELVEVDLGPTENTFIEPYFLTTRGLVRLHQRRFEEAEADLRRLVTLTDGRGWTMPATVYQRIRLAEVLARTERPEQARELMDFDIAVAQKAGLRGALGIALRIKAMTYDGDECVALLNAADEALSQSPLRREHGWALHDLGNELRRGGEPKAAREPLTRALDIASRTESALLGRLVRSELEQAGARPRREHLTGIESLTPSERRVSEMAAEGLSNREIADSLWVTLKTVEIHLSHSYAKLGIRSRKQLPEVMGTVAAA